MAAPENEQELLRTASALAGRTLAAVARINGIDVPADLRRAKGWVGELLEKALGATAQSRPVPDFEHLGIELKTVPLNARLLPQESTYVSTVPLTDTAGLRWSESTVKAKLNRVLWIPVEAALAIPVAERRIGRPVLWSPTSEDSKILHADWEEHIECIALGRLDELDARSGTYLQIRPKAFNRNARTATNDASGARSVTLPRGFYLRTVFTRKILSADYIAHRIKTE
jgi:DNA mismatch repair protein MutH